MSDQKARRLLARILEDKLIVFRVVDLGSDPECDDPFLFPRPGALMGVMYFTAPEFVALSGPGSALSEDEFARLPPNQQNRYRRTVAIHIPKALWDHVQGNVHFQSQLVLDVYNQMYPEARVDERTLWSIRALSMGASDLDLFFVDHAAERRNIEYLRLLTRTAGSDDDPHGALAAAARQALENLCTV